MLPDQQYWEKRYQNSETGWDLGIVSPPIKNYVDQLEDLNISILIPGCGNAYEANYLLEKGFTNITLIDISPSLVEHLKALYNFDQQKHINIICGDFFEMKGAFELVIEQTFFCAIQPKQRKDYCKKMHELLAPNGKLVGLLFNRTFENNPPFGGSIDEYVQLFTPYFNIIKMEPCYNSILPRQGSELFIKLTKRSNEEINAS
jgi:SAM-dependent methyltransferase